MGTYSAARHKHAVYAALAHTLSHWAGVSQRILGDLIWGLSGPELHQYLLTVKAAGPSPYGPGAGIALDTTLYEWIGGVGTHPRRLCMAVPHSSQWCVFGPVYGLALAW